jgi:uncharacterized RDD family membrane protein YckC
MAESSNYNPYAPPGSDGESPQGDDDRHAFRPATLGRRFLGAMIDGVVNTAALYITRSAMNGAPLSWEEMFGQRAQEQRSVASLFATLVPLGIMAWLIAKRGQSVGKIVMGTRIVDEEGRRAGLYNGFVLRTLPFAAIGFIPSLLMATGMPFQSALPFTFIVSFVSLIDTGLILGAHRRCLHDRIAGTYVAVVGTERPPKDDAPRQPRKKKRRKAAAVGQA